MLTAAAINLEFTKARPPIDGRISRAQLTLGSLAVGDQSVLTSAVSQHSVYAYFNPNEHIFLNYQSTLKHSEKPPCELFVGAD